MPRLILLPGLGTTRLLFEPQRHAFDQSLFLPDWIQPVSTKVAGRKPIPESLPDYARRLAERWKETVLSNADTRREYYLGGVSFGGMVALECARYLTEEKIPPRGVLLIASVRTSDAIPGFLRMKLALLTLLGPGLVKSLLPRIISRVAAREGLSELDTRLFRRMADAASIEHTIWGATAIRSWRFTESDWKALVRAGIAIHQIHGERDWAFPPPAKGSFTSTMIPGGRHLINITHADQVNDFISVKLGLPRAADSA